MRHPQDKAKVEVAVQIAERWIHKFERGRLRALADLKAKLEGENDG